MLQGIIYKIQRTKQTIQNYRRTTQKPKQLKNETERKFPDLTVRSEINADAVGLVARRLLQRFRYVTRQKHNHSFILEIGTITSVRRN